MRLIIIGAGGHGKVVADNALKNGYTDIFFVDDKSQGECMDLPIVGTTENLACLNDGNTEFIIAVGNNDVRRRISEKYDVNWGTLIHPSAQIACGVSIGQGSVVMAGAVINTCSTVGRHCIINTGAIVEHDNRIEDYVHLSPRVALAGNVHVGEMTHIGIGSSVLNNVAICDRCTIGAGAVVIESINNVGTYVGVPVRKIK